MKKNVSFKFALALCSVLALAACSKKSTPDLNAATGPGAGVAVPGSEQDFAVNVGDRIYFENDQSTLSAEAQKRCAARPSGWRSMPMSRSRSKAMPTERGTREYNIALSARRATATREFLIAQGVDASRISSIAYGKERPAALCDAEQCWSQNRRAVTVITGGAQDKLTCCIPAAFRMYSAAPLPGAAEFPSR